MNLNWGNKTIVIVDDIEVNYILLREQLKKTGAKFIWLVNGEDSVNYIKEGNKADLILMDVRMPIMNGIDATSIIKKLRPNLPIILQTACVMGADCEDLEDTECDGFIYKPIIAEELIKLVSEHLNA